MTLKKIDYVLIFGMILILLVGIFIIYYYFNSINNECVSSPLVFGAKQLEDKYTGVIHGTIVFLTHSGNSPLITFNSTSISIQE